jgi:3-dehydroquinate dehydratase-2
VILLVNGPNLNLLGEREPEVYGADTLADVERMVRQECAAHGLDVEAFQSNSEGAILDFIQEHRAAARGIILNPGALTHTSYALHDCLKAVRAPAVEVHVSNVHAREEWRRRSVISPAVKGTIAGLGTAGYRLAARWLCERLAAEASRDPAPVARFRPEPRGSPWPALGHDAEARAFRGREVDAGAAGEAPEEIPVDVTKRGDYEP